LLRELGSGSEVSGWLAEEAAEALDGAHLLVVEACAAGPGGCLVDPGVGALTGAAATAGVPVWAVAGTGRVLPELLFAALSARADPADLVAADALEAVVGPDGPAAPAGGLVRSDCPALVELTH
jgi:hypothetical protein